MELAPFIHDLITEGKVNIHHKIQPFSPQDLALCQEYLQDFYDQDRLNMPYHAPMFEGEAAIWGATLIYRSIQMIMLREIPSSEAENHLQSYHSSLNPQIIYSIDLILRYLPEVFNLAKGLAPEDIVVKQMRQSAIMFPFSSIGIDLEEELNVQPILKNQSLTYAYIDRIIEKKATSRLKNPQISALVQEVLGQHAAQIWPGLSHFINHN